jgi:hypothetical protein
MNQVGHYLYGGDLQEAAERMHPEMFPKARIPGPNEAPTPMAQALGADDLDLRYGAMHKRAPGAPQEETSNNTPLNPTEMNAYHKWARSIGRDPAKEEKDYDLRGYWKDIVVGNPDLPDRLKETVGKWQNEYRRHPGAGHFPDLYKKPTHPTFSDESIYHGPALSGVDENLGGHWDMENHTFTPGPSNLAHHSPEEIRKYFTRTDPTFKVIIPGNP